MGIDDAEKQVFADAVGNHHPMIPDVMDRATFEEGREEEESANHGTQGNERW